MDNLKNYLITAVTAILMVWIGAWLRSKFRSLQLKRALRELFVSELNQLPILVIALDKYRNQGERLGLVWYLPLEAVKIIEELILVNSSNVLVYNHLISGYQIANELLKELERTSKNCDRWAQLHDLLLLKVCWISRHQKNFIDSFVDYKCGKISPESKQMLEQLKNRVKSLPNKTN
ncbi:MAG: hypothetical protein GY928_17380 [Colwellia sp.]|nr:hypothetical protein [Colwellia sp.]